MNAVQVFIYPHWCPTVQSKVVTSAGANEGQLEFTAATGNVHLAHSLCQDSKGKNITFFSVHFRLWEFCTFQKALSPELFPDIQDFKKRKQNVSQQ